MNKESSDQELYHEIFGSILDRSEMTPYLLLKAGNYATALKQATRMMGNRGFDTFGYDELQTSEKERAHTYIEQVYKYLFHWMLPPVRDQLERLATLQSANREIYRHCLGHIRDIGSILKDGGFRRIINEDPRHLFLLASSKKYPHVFYGYKGTDMDVPSIWQQVSCALLKMGFLIKSIEEDSQDINDYAQLGVFLEMRGQSLHDLYNYDWTNPEHFPENESAQKAFVKIATFFYKLKESVTFDTIRECLVFNSGDGVEIDIIDIKARLKRPESMFTKLGRDVESEAYDIRDILAITFLLKSKDDTLKLVHALQKRGVILQENTVSHTITQTLFDNEEDMVEAVRRLMISLSRSEGNNAMPHKKELLANAKKFYEALSINTERNPHSSLGHKKFQCKINFSLPIHHAKAMNQILIPGTPEYVQRDTIGKITQQHTLALELRISDEESWRMSEQAGDSHHEAYKFRQMISVMNRVFKNLFYLPQEHFAQLRKDQAKLFPDVRKETVS